MEFTSQTPNDYLYLSAPNSPSDCSMRFYSAPTSPIKRAGNASFGYESSPTTPKTNEDANSNFDDFEFETSRKFCDDGFEFETSQRFEYSLYDHEEQRKQQQSRPTMAFADELFREGQVVPLKLPPRLQYATQNSTASSPSRSPTSSVLKIPFSWRNMWNDDFDPFMVALEKVKEEKKGKNSHHRRTQSLSPKWSNDSGGPLEPIQHQMGLSPNEGMESKGSAYARWVRDHNRQMDPKKSSSQVNQSPRTSHKLKGFPFGRRVKKSHEGPTKPVPGPTVNAGENTEENRGQKIKGFLLKYASFGRYKNESKKTDQMAALRKPIYFKNLSFKFKGNAKSSDKKKKVNEEPKMALAHYRPRLTLCLGYGIGSPRNTN